jgi:hypothetical protein
MKGKHPFSCARSYPISSEFECTASVMRNLLIGIVELFDERRT